MNRCSFLTLFLAGMYILNTPPSRTCPTCIGYPYTHQKSPFLNEDDESYETDPIFNEDSEREIDPPIFHGLPPDEQ